MTTSIKPAEQLRVFLCHCSEDKDAVRSLHDKLLTSGHLPWLDEKQLLPGQDWDLEIRRAIRRSHVILVCLSDKTIVKRGYVQKEIVRALDIADEQPEGAIFVIPAKLRPCDVPERLRRWQWVDLTATEGYARLEAALQAVLKGIHQADS